MHCANLGLAPWHLKLSLPCGNGKILQEGAIIVRAGESEQPACHILLVDLIPSNGSHFRGPLLVHTGLDFMGEQGRIALHGLQPKAMLAVNLDNLSGQDTLVLEVTVSVNALWFHPDIQLCFR